MSPSSLGCRLWAILLALCLTACHAVTTSKPEVGAWWVPPAISPFDASRLKAQSYVQVRGNRFVDDQSATLIFRGVSISDPDALARQSRWRKSLFEEIRRWGANAVRIPVHPAAWRSRGEGAYLSLLDDAVYWANDLGLYLILDWHSIGYLPNELFQDPVYNTTVTETLRFWRTTAARYRNVPTLALYEIFNEPTTLGGALGQPDWEEWKSLNEKIIDLIRANDPSAIPVVSGFDWAYDLSSVRTRPISRDGIAYAVHPYPQKASAQPPTEENFHQVWQRDWGFVAERYPLIATELGWVRPDGRGAHVPVINDGSYGPHILSFMESRGISWIAWCFDPDWMPALIEGWDFTPTEQGAFFKEAMQGKPASQPQQL
jgi:endoglucanase